MGRRRRRMMMTRRRWRGRGGMRRICRTAWCWRRHDSQIPLVPFRHFCSSCFKFFFFQQEEVKKQHRRDTQRPNIMNYLLTPKAPDHPPHTTLPCLPEKCNHCGKNLSRKSSLSKNMVRSMEPAVSQKYCKTDTWPS